MTAELIDFEERRKKAEERRKRSQDEVAELVGKMNKQYCVVPEGEDLIRKAVAFDAVPVLIARRVPYVSFLVLNRCGVIIHQTYNQRFPEASRALGEKAADKRLLGFHDIRFGNQPDARLIKFLHVNLPDVLPRARDDFDQFKDLLSDYGSGGMPY